MRVKCLLNRDVLLGKSWLVNIIDSYLKAMEYLNDILQWDYTQIIFCGSTCMLEWTPSSRILCRLALLRQCPLPPPPPLEYVLNAFWEPGSGMASLFLIYLNFYLYFGYFIHSHYLLLFCCTSPSCSLLLFNKFQLFTLPQK